MHADIIQANNVTHTK